MRHADFYERDGEVFFLRDIPKQYRQRIKSAMENQGAPYLRLKLSSGHLFSLPIVSRNPSDDGMSLSEKMRSRGLAFAKANYFRFSGILERLGLLARVRLAGAKMIQKSGGLDDKNFFEDDNLFEFVGQTLITNDKSYGKPLTIGLSLTNRCNLACQMCPYHGPDEKLKHSTNYFNEKHTITKGDFEKVVKYCAEHGVTLQLGQQDEPLMLLFKEGYAEVLQKYQPLMTLTTNGTLLRGEKQWKYLASLEHLHHVGISIDGHSPEVYKKIRGDDLELLHTQLHGFFDYLKKHRPDIKRRVCFVEQPDNLHERDDFLNYWKQHVHQVSFYKETEFEDDELVFVRNYKVEKRTPCSAIFNTMYIMPDTKVQPCCLFMYSAPYVGMNTITKFSDDAWESDTYHKFRTQVTSENFGSICDKCTIWRQGMDREYTVSGMRVTENPYEKHYFM